MNLSRAWRAIKLRFLKNDLPDHLQRGRNAEDVAVRMLRRKKYRILARNYRHGKGEIDIVAGWGEEVVFVEVRARTDVEFALPEQTITRNKRKRIVATARHFMRAHRLDDKSYRFDVIAIKLDENGVSGEIEHFENAFGSIDR